MAGAVVEAVTVSWDGKSVVKIAARKRHTTGAAICRAHRAAHAFQREYIAAAILAKNLLAFERVGHPER
jgi:hypothetical protein